MTGSGRVLPLSLPRDLDHRGCHRFGRAFAAPGSRIGRPDRSVRIRSAQFRRGLRGFRLSACARRASAPHSGTAASPAAAPDRNGQATTGCQHRQQVVDVAAFRVRHLHVELAGELQRADAALPDEKHPVMAPAPGESDDQFSSFNVRTAIRWR